MLRGSDLRPEVTHQTLFRRENSHDPLRDAVELLWAGEPVRALRLLDQEPASVRVRALIAECRRDLGHHEEAVAALRELVTESIGAGRESFMRRHLGKAFLATEQTEKVIEQFRIAVEVRRCAAEPARFVSAGSAVRV